MHVAFVTSRSQPALSADDALAVAPLAQRGVSLDAVPWDAPATWSRYDAVVVRSCWDYHLRLAEFSAWIDRMEVTGVTLWNPPSLLRWNATKTYLFDLAARGVATVPSKIVHRGRGATLAEVRARTGWADFVVKPMVSNSGYETWRFAEPAAAEDAATFQRVAGAHDLLVQPFVPEIARSGEWSLVFLGGQYLHAVVKRPGACDFRVQAEHGGEERAASAPHGLVQQASAIVRLAAPTALHARVDAFARGDRFVLTELEVLEPSLFLAHCADAPARFASAIARLTGA